MKKYKILSPGFFTILMVLLACKKYDQPYNYKKIDDIKISTSAVNNRFTVVINDTLKIEPVIAETNPSNDEFEYEWRLLEQITPKFWVISQSKDLKAKIDIPAGSYYLGFKITNKRTGQIFTYQGMVSVISPFNAGYYVTSNVGNQGKLSFIRASDDMIFYSAPEEVNGNKTYPGKALFADNSAATGTLVCYFTDQGIYRFTANDFLENGRDAQVMDGAKKFSRAPIAYGDGASAWEVFMMGDGDLHVGIGSTMASFYGNNLLLAPFSARLVGDYSLYSGIFVTSSTTMFYDNKFKRFMYCPTQGRNLTIAPASLTSVFNAADVKMTLISSDAGQATNEYYYLMENAAGVRYLLGTLNTTPNLYQIIGNSPDIGTATVIAASKLVKHVYYASANKLYVYDMLANSSRLVYTYPLGYVIKDMKMDRSTSKRLVLGVSKSASEGEVHYFDLDNLGAAVGNSPVKTFKGFGDIVSVNSR
ncbi:PKD-like family lipoprotein [Pedobacter sp. GR22-6]|uniref:PKD-like family lipoprotein n=1 Tax=Pedobacter sp. GR22-6 TaxID=3127957 RepID=UPI00307D4C4A